MKTLIIGDIFGKPGRHTIKEVLGKLKKEHEFDLIIANGENLAHGRGMTIKTFNEMREIGIDFFTTGNHVFSNHNIFPELIKTRPRIIRPANFPEGNIGHGHRILSIKKKKILIINLTGRVFMERNYDCPFRKIDQILAEHKKEKLDGILVDFHAEATSEKMAMKHYLDGRVTALLGTHTHVPTADSEITSKNMAYVTDIGMTGPTDSVIGVTKESVIESFLKQSNFKLDAAPGPCIFNAVMIEILGWNKAKNIEHIQIKHETM